MPKEILPKRDIQTPEGWIVQPLLWVDAEVRSFEENGITFVVEGKAIKAAIKATNLEEREFLREASAIVERFVNAYMIVKGVFFEIPGLTSKYLVSQPSYPALEVLEDTGKTIRKNFEDTLNYDAYTWLEKEGDSEKNFKFSLRMLKLLRRDDTLRGCLKFFRSALAGSDYLLVTGNLYMVLELLICEFGDEKRTAGFLVCSHNNFNRVKMLLNKGRHAIGRGGVFLESKEIEECKQEVRKLILAYAGLLDSMNTVTLDTVCIIHKFDSSSPDKHREMVKIFELHESRKLEVAVSTRIINDKSRDQDFARRVRDVDFALKLRVIPSVFRVDVSYLPSEDRFGDIFSDDEMDDKFGQLHRIFWGKRTIPNENEWERKGGNDLDHLFAHWINERDVFLTYDDDILKRKEELFSELGITVQTPTEFLKKFS